MRGPFVNTCRHCHTSIDPDHTLCETCELRFCMLLLRLACDLAPLRAALDATIHPGGHQPARAKNAVPPTPIRLDVLDVLDILDSTIYELARRLDGTDAHPDATDTPPRDLHTTLLHCAGHPRLATFPDAGLYLHVTERLARQADMILDPPTPGSDIGPCPTCATMLTAGERDQWVTCPTCGSVERVRTVKMRRLERLCFDESKRGTPAMVARAFMDAGIHVRRNTISQWARRGRLAADDDGLVAYCDVYRLLLAPHEIV